jgi:hypothetical protein
MKNGYPKIFISHAHHDRELAVLLTDYLKSVYRFEDRDIRCSSIFNNSTEVGKIVDEALKRDIKNAIGVIALLSYEGLHSTYVKFELGASWILGKIIIPVMGPQAKGYEKHLGPIRGLRYIEIEAVDAEQALAKDIHRLLTAKHLLSAASDNPFASLNNFITYFKKHGSVRVDFAGASVEVVYPERNSTVPKILNGRVKIYGALPENGHLWVAVVDVAKRLLWPKQHIEAGQDSFHLEEHGTPSPGELDIWLIGVGPVVTERFALWQKQGDAKGAWTGFHLDDLEELGVYALDKITGLTWIKN